MLYHFTGMTIFQVDMGVSSIVFLTSTKVTVLRNLTITLAKCRMMALIFND